LAGLVPARQPASSTNRPSNPSNALGQRPSSVQIHWGPSRSCHLVAIMDREGPQAHSWRRAQREWIGAGRVVDGGRGDARAGASGRLNGRLRGRDAAVGFPPRVSGFGVFLICGGCGGCGRVCRLGSGLGVGAVDRDHGADAGVGVGKISYSWERLCPPGVPGPPGPGRTPAAAAATRHRTPSPGPPALPWRLLRCPVSSDIGQ